MTSIPPQFACTLLNEISESSCMDNWSVQCLDAVAGIETIAKDSVSAIITDPPYGQGQDIEGDVSVDVSITLLGKALKASGSKLRRGAHVAIFWSSMNLDLCIDVTKESGFTFCRLLTMYIPKGGARPYMAWLPRTQPIVLCRNYLSLPPSEYHMKMAAWLDNGIQQAGISKTAIARHLGCDSRLVMKWSRVGDPAWCLPTPRFYRRLKTLLQLGPEFDDLLDRPPAKPERNGRSYEYRHDVYIVDKTKQGSFHPTEKPLDVVRHLVSSLTKPGETVLDPFCGSGTTGIACRELGRRFIGFDIDSRYVDTSRQRINSCLEDMW